ncbi:MAG TPA: dicarboxylate/amino acid:cation symporter [Acidobacteriaceae bacterium]|nr:dicarboxylate/amino acid:cation symporter [Acidobacteriaceae bacterium]
MTEARQSASRHAFTIIGLIFYCAGLAAAFLHAHWHAGLLLRAAGLLLLAYASWKRRSLMAWIFWAMIAGGELGADAPNVAVSLRVFSDIFLRLIKTIVAPLILGTLITGIAAHGQMRSLGRMGIKALIYFEVLTTIAMLVGLAAINLTRAGVGLTMPQHSAVEHAQTPMRWDEVLLHTFPENIAKSVADNQILQVAVFAILFGAAMTRLSAEKRAPLLHVIESLTETMFSFTNIVMYYAPVGVGAAMAYTVGQMGPGVLLHLGRLLLTLYAALLVFVLVGMLPVALIARVPIRRFLRAVAEPATIAFATSTSEAALPRAMEAMEALGVPRRIVAFVIPAGYSFNLDGSTLYLALASVFVAQAAGVTMSWKQQIFMVATLMLTSKGVAGVPRATLVVLLATVAMFRLPEEPIFVILGIDALMDMARTSVNVVGNCLASAVVARWEGEFGAEAPAVETMDALP